MFVHIDTNRVDNNVMVDLGGIPPNMALIPLMSAYRSVEALCAAAEQVSILHYGKRVVVEIPAETPPFCEPVASEGDDE
jgi:hypothetical protein